MKKVLFILLFAWSPMLSSTSSYSEEICYEFSQPEKPTLSDEDIGLLLLKRWEGLVLTPYWDVNAYRIGWGCTASGRAKITAEEADKLVERNYRKIRERITKRYPKLTSWQTAIFSVMAFNVGHFGRGLDAALKAGDLPRAAKLMLLYVNCNGKPLQGLVNRRVSENKLLTSSPEDREALAAELEAIVNKHILNTNG